MLAKIQKFLNADENHSKSSLPNTNLDIRNLPDEKLRVYKSIFPKISRSPFVLEITSTRVIRYQEIDFNHENALGIRTGGLHVDFAQNVNFSPGA